jgi:hypothetical protein
MASREIDNAEPVEAETDVVLEVEADIVGSAMARHITHPVDDELLDLALPIEIE